MTENVVPREVVLIAAPAVKAWSKEKSKTRCSKMRDSMMGVIRPVNATREERARFRFARAKFVLRPPVMRSKWYRSAYGRPRHR